MPAKVTAALITIAGGVPDISRVFSRMSAVTLARLRAVTPLTRITRTTIVITSVITSVITPVDVAWKVAWMTT